MASNVKVTSDVAAKRVQSRLNKKSIKKDLPEIRDFFNSLDLEKEEFSKEDMDAAFNFFSGGELVIFNAREKALEISKTYFLDLTPTQLNALEALTSEDEIREEIYKLINQESKEEEENKGELIKSAAQEMGVTLTAEEVYLVAQEINTSSDNLEETLDEIKTAVINFINYKVQANSQKIASAMEEITQVATSGLNKNSQELKNGLNKVNEILKGGAMDFKRISQAFKTPA
jgi:NTP pyrophosphatase (non-canonical NTP hydrolase)